MAVGKSKEFSLFVLKLKDGVWPSKSQNKVIENFFKGKDLSKARLHNFFSYLSTLSGNKKKYYEYLNFPMSLNQIAGIQHNCPKGFIYLAKHKESKILKNFPVMENAFNFDKKIIAASSHSIFEKLYSARTFKEGMNQAFGTNSKELMKMLNQSYKPQRRSRNPKSYEGYSVESIPDHFLYWVNFLSKVYLSGNDPDLFRLLVHTPRYEDAHSLTTFSMEFLLDMFPVSTLKDMVPSFTKKEFQNRLSNLEELVFGLKKNQIEEVKAVFKTVKFDSRKIEKFFDNLQMIVATRSNSSKDKLNQSVHYKGLKNLEKKSFVVNKKTYSVEVAKTSLDLILWGMEMGHCVGGKQYRIDTKKGRCLLLTLKENGKRRWTVEINRNKKGVTLMTQIQGKSGSHPTDEVSDAFEKFLKKSKVLTEGWFYA